MDEQGKGHSHSGTEGRIAETAQGVEGKVSLREDIRASRLCQQGLSELRCEEGIRESVKENRGGVRNGLGSVSVNFFMTMQR